MSCRIKKLFIPAFIALALSLAPAAFGGEGASALEGPKILEISLLGNVDVVEDYVLGAVTSKVGEPVDEEKLRRDAEAIFELGFFVGTDYRVTDRDGGVAVTFLVQENPKVGSIEFTGNTLYTSEQLSEIVFTKPGALFNRTFFKNDIQRIKEKYQADGYVMASVKDVRIDGDRITVVISEPRISEIIIQGNKITKRKIVERYLKFKEGDIFNANKLRLSLSRLQNVGFFSDVNVNFEQGENPDDVVVVLTVEEGKTGRLGLNVAYGTESGFGGGLSYENFNIGGAGLKLNVGFDLGDRKEYWLSFEQPYMSGRVAAWKVGAYRREWDDIWYYISDAKQFEYDRSKTGAYVGFGRKFKDESLYNWYLLLDWHRVENEPTDGSSKSEWGNTYVDPDTTILDDLGDGDYYSATASLRRANIDEYLPYSKGDVEILNLQYGAADVQGRSYDYFKYWLEARVYFPMDKLLRDFFENPFGADQDRPIMFAARVIIGDSSGDIPYEELYTIGGDKTLRGYEEDRFHGEQMLLGNFELRVPVEKNLTFVAFYDIGRAWRSSQNISFGSDLGKAPGIGIRVNTPLGNLRLDYADGDEDDKIHFGFGELF